VGVHRILKDIKQVNSRGS